MTYLRLMLGTALLLLMIAAAVNVLVDPAKIYRTGGSNPSTHADRLVVSARGLWWAEDSYDERSLKLALAKQSQRAECVVVGSSRVFQISSHRIKKALAGECESLLNLAVSGAGIEDHITLTYEALKNGRPKKIVLGVDPWVFAFGKDQRWSQYEGEYDRARSAILSKASPPMPKDSNIWRDKLVNLISLEYTVRSVRQAVREPTGTLSAITNAPKLDENLGGDYPALLPDGSLVYSARYIAESGKQPIPLGGSVFMTNGQLIESDAIDAYRSLLLWIKSQGAEPILLLIPYHENVWKAPNSPTTVALRTVEPIARSLARDVNAKIIGSYDPHAVGCLSSEFYDFMHPTTDCLAKLRVH